VKRLSPPPPAPGSAFAGSGWRRVGTFLRRFRPPRRLKLTRDGKYFIGITFGVGFVAIATANNLLYLMLGMLLSLIVVSGVLSEMSLRHLRVTRRLPARAQVGRAHLVEIEVHNDKTRMPSYAIEVEDLRAGQPADKRCFFLKISPRSAQIAAYRRTPARRGLDRHVGFRVATRFPFGFFEKSREISCDGELIIYPGVDPVRLDDERPGNRLGGAGAQGRGTGDEVIGVRPMREGDDPRDIYWRKSTTGGPMVLMERVQEARRDVRLEIDNVHSDAAPTPEWDDRFERRLRQIASLTVAHLKRGEVVQLVTTHGERAVAGPSTGADPALRFLALLEAHAAATPATSSQANGAQADGRPAHGGRTLGPGAAGAPATPRGTARREVQP
jgi:uncharacterized protein (DUF58 family)